MPQNCTTTPQYVNGVLTGYCQDCPEIAATPAVPQQVITDPQLGWNSSARSARELTGDCYTEFTVPAGVVGVVCGLSDGYRSTLPRDVAHAFYVYQSAGAEWWRIMEGGVAVTAPVRRIPASDTFRIERRGDVVTYYFNGRRHWVSDKRSVGVAMVVACMYSAGDGVE